MSNKITCNNFVYSDSDILSGNCYIGNSLAGEELSIDTLDATLNVAPATFVTSDGDSFTTSDGYAFVCANPISGYKYGDEVKYENNDSLIGKFYFEKPVRRGKSKYEFSCMSAVGLLDNITHYGGIYAETTAGVIIAELMGDIPYTIDSSVSSIPVDGWLPVATCRENLQQVLFATGGGIFKDSTGEVVIRFVQSSTPVTINDNRIYIDGSEDYDVPCTRVDVTEHAYHALTSDNVVTLISSEDTLDSQLVKFDSPCHNLIATGLTIESSGVNYAIVSGTGSLTGKAYTHTKKVISMNTGMTGKENVVSVTDATLVSAFNSYNVALRVSQYYSAVSTVSIGLVVGDERPTTEVSFMDTFGDLVSGYIKSLDISLSAKLKADVEIAIGFLPVGHGNIYSNYVVLTGSGSWTVPSGVVRIYAILVGGGYGGNGGSGGGANVIGGFNNNDHIRAGGVGGQPGNGGLIYETNLNVSQGSLCVYSCGEGGDGGSPGNGNVGNEAPTVGGVGAEGTATTFNTLSSALGNAVSNYVEPKSGLLLGNPGTDGVAGGRGSYLYNSRYPTAGNSISFDGSTYTPGSDGLSGLIEYGSTSGIANSGLGGGAAVGSNGTDGEGDYVYAYPNINCKNGGKGATSAVDGALATTYGGGGGGGHGGGGGGKAGDYFPDAIDPLVLTEAVTYDGNGGNGSSGGKGGDGCVIIYY